MKVEIGFRWSSRKLSVEIGAEFETASVGLQLGAAVKAVLRGAVLRDAVLRDAVLRGAVLRDADLSGAVLRGADLSDAVLRDAVLRGAVLRDAVLRDAVLSDADLRGADLSADLSGADLSGADLSGADLSGAVLRGAKGLTDDSIVAPGNVTLGEFKRDIVPALLVAGGKTLEAVMASGCWDCHSWDNCPLHVAHNVRSTSQLPPMWRAHGALFVSLFDGGHIPAPVVEKAAA